MVDMGETMTLAQNIVIINPQPTGCHYLTRPNNIRGDSMNKVKKYANYCLIFQVMSLAIGVITGEPFLFYGSTHFAVGFFILDAMHKKQD